MKRLFKQISKERKRIMNKLLLACLITCLQVNASMLLQPFFTVYTIAKDHVVGPMDQQQYNGFVEGALQSVTHFGVEKITTSSQPRSFIYSTTNCAAIASITLKVKNGNSATILARAAGYVLFRIILIKYFGNPSNATC
jgi:hypothetical protein